MLRALRFVLLLSGLTIVTALARARAEFPDTPLTMGITGSSFS
jgi:hypothetical protein